MRVANEAGDLKIRPRLVTRHQQGKHVPPLFFLRLHSHGGNVSGLLVSIFAAVDAIPFRLTGSVIFVTGMFPIVRSIAVACEEAELR